MSWLSEIFKSKTTEQIALDYIKTIADAKKADFRRKVLQQLDGTANGNAEADLCEAYLLQRGR